MTGRWTLLVASAALAGCATLPPPSVSGAPVDTQTLTARAAALGLAEGDCAAARWGMTGRVALSNGRDGGTGRLQWSQGEGRLQLELSAPVTGQSWTLEADAESAVLRGLPDGATHGVNADALVRAATGWVVPVNALGCWLRGVAADSAEFGSAQVEIGFDGLPLQIRQSDWTIDYDGWKPDAASGQPMPAKVTASRGQNRVRLVVDRWLAQ